MASYYDNVRIAEYQLDRTLSHDIAPQDSLIILFSFLTGRTNT